MKKFRNKMLQGIYELGLIATYPIPLDFYKAALGGSARVAWENGYLGRKITRYDKDSIAHAAFCAGQEVKRQEIASAPGKALEKSTSVYINPDHYGVLRIEFNEPTIIRYGKHATELVPAYKGSLWGSKRYLRKWGVEIFDPKKTQKYKHTFREVDGDVFEFEITEIKLFENKNEMKKFMETMPLSPFVVSNLVKEEEQKKLKKQQPKKEKAPDIEYEVQNNKVIVTGRRTYDAKNLLKEMGLTWSGKAWEGTIEPSKVEELIHKGFSIKKKN